MTLPVLPLLLCCALFGLTIGSFLNVVVYRVPAGMSVAHPRSACPGCGAAIRPRDNIPVVSWMVLRGRCRGCHQAISARYPALEALTGVLFVGAGLRFGWSPTLPAVVVFFAGLLALAAVDLERYLLPKKIVYPTGILTAAVLVVAAAAQGQWSRLAVAAACGAVAFGLFFALNFVNPAWLGFGDVRLAAVIGVMLGWLGVSYVILAFLVANVTGIAVMGGLIGAGKAGRKTKMPYGVFLAVGAVVAVFAGGPFGHLLRPGS
ncbi:prepilin peptidase [Acidiferrimicrobium sp. IK]|uniref:prepilin peptidase n=1 Tax=Acidiferrimicrobium sp. IK TaxID=2871700 RepID=UPI0021CB977F|nr:A24 family peptidase [Acidiferrimicrobium sp. IK]MCU4184815.1 prepilin peptidase [Acidiferrimicrobium sp. IK]